jgi:hypothetical protein
MQFISDTCSRQVARGGGGRKKKVIISSLEKKIKKRWRRSFLQCGT